MRLFFMYLYLSIFPSKTAITMRAMQSLPNDVAWDKIQAIHTGQFDHIHPQQSESRKCLHTVPKHLPLVATWRERVHCGVPPA
jgi:hypothetical protein